MNFTCPECGSDELEEVLLGVTQTSPIADIDEDGCLTYGNGISCDGGLEAWIACASCGTSLHTESGMTVRDGDDLLEWLKEQELTN